MRAILVLMFLTTCAYADGIWQDKDYRRDSTVHVSSPVISIQTDMETGKVIERNEPEPTVTSCVEMDDGGCQPSRYFVATITDVKE